MTPKKILIIGPAWIGDMIMAQSLFKQLKQKHPDTDIDVLAPAWTHPLLKRMPEIHDALISPFKHGEFGLRKRYQLGKALRKRHYDQAIVLQNSFKSALIPFFAKISTRTGFRSEMRYILLNDIRRLDKKETPLMVERFLILAEPKNRKKTAPIRDWQKFLTSQLIPHLSVSSPAIQHARKKHQLPDNNEPIVALCPGAAYGPAKRWPAEYFAVLANMLLKQGYAVWLFGSKQDNESAEKIQAETNGRCINLCGKTSLEDAVDLLAAVTVVVTNDSGLMHTAAALDKPLVAIYGSSTPTFTPPLQKKAKILATSLSCRPCFKRHCPYGHLKCLYDIPPQSVMDTILKLTAP